MRIRVKGRAMVVWIGLAMMVSTRLWLAGAVSQTRDRHLAERLLSQVRACALAVRTLLVPTDPLDAQRDEEHVAWSAARVPSKGSFDLICTF